MRFSRGRPEPLTSQLSFIVLFFTRHAPRVVFPADVAEVLWELVLLAFRTEASRGVLL